MPNPNLTDADRAAVLRSAKQTRMVKAARKLARMVPTVHPSEESLKRRAELEPTLAPWLKYYLPEAFCFAWGSVHLECCSTLQQCIDHGGSFALAMPRGSGKSAIGKGSCIYAPLLGKRSYVVPIGANDMLANDYLDYIKGQLDGSNERLAEDYPECVGFFKALDWKAINAQHQLRSDGKKTGIAWRIRGITFPTVLDEQGTPYPFSGARVECRGITAALKGMSKNAGGHIIRPDFVLPDDVQTEDDALSATACNKIENKITGTVLALAGPRKRIACFMPCTVVETNDVSDRFLDKEKHSEFQGKRIPLFVKWPKAQKTLWDEYAIIRRIADDDSMGKKLATEFYVKNRREMDKGAVVSWPDRIRDGELSAIETGENLLIEMRDKFWSEMQQDPVSHGDSCYVLTPELIQSRAEPDRAPGIVPDWAIAVVATTDINPSYALTSTVTAFGKNQRSAVLWYGLHKMVVPTKKGMTDAMQYKLIYEELARLGPEIAGLPCRPNLWVIDGGGSPEGTVIDFAANAPKICGLEAVCAFGRGWKQYRPTGKHKVIIGEQLHRTVQSRARQWIIWSSDYWREASHKGWTGAPGGPGSCSLPRGRHSDFATQASNEPLTAKGKGLSGKTEWIYKNKGIHDYGDCMAMAYMGAALLGIGTGGYVEPTSGRKKYTQKDLRR